MLCCELLVSRLAHSERFSADRLGMTWNLEEVSTLYVALCAARHWLVERSEIAMKVQALQASSEIYPDLHLGVV